MISVSLAHHSGRFPAVWRGRETAAHPSSGGLPSPKPLGGGPSGLRAQALSGGGRKHGFASGARRGIWPERWAGAWRIQWLRPIRARRSVISIFNSAARLRNNARGDVSEFLPAISCRSAIHASSNTHGDVPCDGICVH